MSGNELIKEVGEGAVEEVMDVRPSFGSTLTKVAIAGAVVAAGVAVVVYIKRRKANKETSDEVVLLDEKTNSKKTEK